MSGNLHSGGVVRLASDGSDNATGRMGTTFTTHYHYAYGREFSCLVRALLLCRNLPEGEIPTHLRRKKGRVNLVLVLTANKYAE